MIVHRAVTVVAGLDGDQRASLVGGIARALQGQPGPFEIEVEVEGTRRVVTPELVSSLGFGEAAAAVAVRAIDLPGAKRREQAPEPAGGTPPGADVDAAEATVERLSTEVAAAKRKVAEANAARRSGAPAAAASDAGAAVADAEERLTEARAATAEARRRLAEAERAAAAGIAAAQATSGLEELRRKAAALEAERAGILTRMVEFGDPGDPAPVEAALEGIERLRRVRPKPSEAAAALADRWARVLERLKQVPPATQPPEWLVAPALAALQQAREDLAMAESGGAPTGLDPDAVDRLERAHRDVLEAEQRAMKKGSRMNRRRLDAAHEAEQTALHALGIRSYGDFLQQTGSVVGAASEARVDEARAALADAEAVWEELHGGDASPEWTAAKEEQAALRREAVALLGAEVDDRELEEVLRSHVEALVETEWAEQSLARALQGAGAHVDEGDDLEDVARRWLTESPARREARARAEADLAALDARLGAVEHELAAHQADAFFGDDEAAEASPGGAIAVDAPEDADDARRRVEEAGERERAAAEAAAAARQRARDAERAHAARVDAEAHEATSELERLTAALDEAKQELAAARSSEGASPAPGGDPTPDGTDPDVDLSGVIGMEAEAYLLARASALRGAPGGPLPMVVDGAAVTGLSAGAAGRVLRLLGRVAESVQVVVVGDDERISTWAGGLGDRADVQRVAR